LFSQRSKSFVNTLFPLWVGRWRGFAAAVEGHPARGRVF